MHNIRTYAITERLQALPARSRVLFFALVLIVVTACCYANVGQHQFLNLDDDLYVTTNAHVATGLTGDNVTWALTAVDYVYWQPVTWLSHMVDIEIFGLNSSGHHVTNLVLHILTSLLVLFFFYRWTGAPGRSAMLALLFALHPLRVESVAWVAERKDVLAGFFWFLTLLFYLEFKAKRRWYLYAACLGAFVLGIMSKPMLVTLPVVLLVIDKWPLTTAATGEAPDRVIGKISLLEKIPFFLLSFASSALTVYGQQRSAGMRDLNEMSPFLRVSNALVSYVAYLWKTFWPADLAVLYPFPRTIPLWQSGGALIVLLLVTVLCLKGGTRRGYLPLGWFWFLCTLLPVIGIFQAGWQSMADRFTYIPGIGILLIVVWGGAELAEKKGLQRPFLVAGVFAVAVSSLLTWQQLNYWHDNVTLFEHALSVTRDNFLIENNLGLALSARGDLDSAINHYRASLKIKPQQVFAHSNLSFALTRKGDLDGAVAEGQEAVQRGPGDASAHINLGIALANKGNLLRAIDEYREALRHHPDNADAHYNLGMALMRTGAVDTAIAEYQSAIRLTPNDADAHMNLGVALAVRGDTSGAANEFREVLRITPDNVQAQNNLRLALMPR